MRRMTGVIGAILALCALGAVAAPSRGEETTDQRAQRMLATDMMVRMSVGRVRSVPDPSAGDYRVAAQSIRLARRRVPEDLEFLRLELEAWDSANEDDQVLTCLEELIKLDPADTAAQLRLIVGRIRKLQDADARLAAYLRLIGPRGASLDPAIRSRIALDAALLARETGDEASFIELLTQAASMDVTNKDAVALATLTFMEQTNDPVERIRLLSDLILSDPLDVGAAQNLTQALVSFGAWPSALRMMEVTRTLLIAQKQPIDIQNFVDYAMVQWRTSGPDAAIKPIDNVQNTEQLKINIDHARRVKAKEVDERLPPQTAVVSSYIELIRMLALFAKGDDKRLAECTGFLEAEIDAKLRMYNKGEGLPPSFTPERIDQSRREDHLTRLLARVLTGLNIAGAIEDFDTTLRSDEPLTHDAKARWMALIDMRLCDTQAAIPVLEHLADHGDLTAGLGLGIAYEEAGLTDEAIAAYAALSYSSPTAMMGAAAATRAAYLRGGVPLPEMPFAPAINEFIKGFAPWLEEMVSNPYKTVSLKMTLPTTTVDLFDRIEAKVEIRNLTRRPLALGAGSTLSSRILVVPDISFGRRETVEQARSDVIELQRRIRLGGGERLEVPIWLNRGTLGSLLFLYPTDSATMRWRLIQGFQLSQENTFDPGPMCVTATSAVLGRPAIAGYSTTAELFESLRVSTGRRQLEDILLVVMEARRRVKDEPDAALLERLTGICGILSQRMESMTSDERVMTIVMMWHAGVFGTDAGKLIAFGARNDTAPLVRLALLQCAVLQPRDPRLDEAEQGDDPLLASIAKSMRESLATSGPFRHPLPEPVRE